MTRDRTQLSRTKGSAVHPSVERGIAKLGSDIAFARRVRKISTTDMAARMGVSRSTLHRLETGDPGISINTLAMALSALGLLDRLSDLADPAGDDVGLMLARKSIPRTVAPRRVRRASIEERPDIDRSRSRGDDEPEGW